MILSTTVFGYKCVPDKLLRVMATFICRIKLFSDICLDVLTPVTGQKKENMIQDRFTVYTTHTPVPSSYKQIIHFAQLVKSGGFKKFDYGTKNNLKRYGQVTPPEYDLGKTSAPVAIWYGANDKVINKTDIEDMYAKIKPGVYLKLMEDETFSHSDFFWHKDILNLYQSLLGYMNNDVEK